MNCSCIDGLFTFPHIFQRQLKLKVEFTNHISTALLACGMRTRFAARHDVNGSKYSAISDVWPIEQVVMFAQP